MDRKTGRTKAVREEAVLRMYFGILFPTFALASFQNLNSDTPIVSDAEWFIFCFNIFFLSALFALGSNLVIIGMFAAGKTVRSITWMASVLAPVSIVCINSFTTFWRDDWGFRSPWEIFLMYLLVVLLATLGGLAYAFRHVQDPKKTKRRKRKRKKSKKRRKTPQTK